VSDDKCQGGGGGDGCASVVAILIAVWLWFYIWPKLDDMQNDLGQIKAAVGVYED
jgi:hypothetical protein